jgi:hypothetical protein
MPEVNDALYSVMASQLTSDRLQECVFAGINGEDIGSLNEAERYFYERGVENAAKYPDAVWWPVDL